MNWKESNRRMKKYLSPQLYQRITGDEDTSLINNRRKRLTIFFSDLVGFSALTDSVEPEVLSTCLNYYLDKMSKIALKYDGTIDKFIGDAIMIFFGDSDKDSDEDNAKNCVKMALEMQENMQWVNEFWLKAGISQPLQVRIGINSGYTTVGNYGTEERMDYTIIGGQVNIAARLESFADAGTVVISDSTKRLVSDEIETESLGEISVKGIHMPLMAHRAIGLKNEPLDRKTKYLLHNETDGFILEKLIYNKAQSSDEEQKNHRRFPPTSPRLPPKAFRLIFFSASGQKKTST